ncbi:3-oxoacyl-ACP reductase [Marmoricola endophyticus]|uniref:3-oxoacyl-ACP reductase n=1 Tax=Marmoricola endophyticus TaxID=2040280 RepID=A0A917F3G4_9ACTN|nr:SDR family NAD(P)-dependent oxidoreductase [Marmoricola endophyticus]GGF45258.1 3-oxoacyl-ACP reductase [Marmoricola endophyticus]
MRELSEQTVLVTGATDGLGRALVHRLAEHQALVVAHGRDPRKLADLVEEVDREHGVAIDTVVADLASLREVDALASAVIAEYDALHCLVSNAGVGFGPPDAPRETSQDGIELRFAVNHLAGYHLAQRLRLLLETSAPSRVVQVASAGQLALDPDDPLTESGYSGLKAYRRAKLAQVMATFDLAADLVGTGVSVNAVHPATMMDTTMVRDTELPAQSTLEEGLDAVWRLVADADLDDVSGRYFDGQEIADPDPQADDPAARAWVRGLSDRLVRDALG